jgi:hypothetical protein
MKKTILYQARLKRNITRYPYGTKKTYKKGTMIDEFTEKIFLSMTSNNYTKHTSLCICEGFNVYEYFDLEDIEFVKITTTIKITTKIVKLNDKK